MEGAVTPTKCDIFLTLTDKNEWEPEYCNDMWVDDFNSPAGLLQSIPFIDHSY